MALGAHRNTSTGRQPRRTQVENLPAVNEVVEEETTIHTQPTEGPIQSPASNAQPPANVRGNIIADMNDGILDNIDGMEIGGNYVTMDGSEFLFKASNETAKEIDIVVTYGKRFYQWFDEDNQQYHNSDSKLDDRYKMKFEIRWEEEVDGEPTEFIMTLPTSSAMNFINYVKTLAQQGLRINQVVTRLSISRQVAKSDNKIRYSRTEFEKVEVLQ